jgi:hypothetical protein
LRQRLELGAVPAWIQQGQVDRIQQAKNRRFPGRRHAPFAQSRGSAHLEDMAIWVQRPARQLMPLDSDPGQIQGLQQLLPAAMPKPGSFDPGKRPRDLGQARDGDGAIGCGHLLATA